MKSLLTSKLSIVLLALSMCIGNLANAQEFNCRVTVNAQQTTNSNLSVFKTLERSLQEFVNQTNWTTKSYAAHERIDCSIFITISSFEGTNFTGSIQVQATRPVFGSTLETTTFNFNDEQFRFDYTEFQPLNYDPNSFDSNLISVVSFYVYTILGIDGDTFAPEGGTVYHEEAKKIVNTAQQGNVTGWRPTDGTRSRFRLNNDLLSETFSNYRTAMYTYHRLGLDVMHQNGKEGKESIALAIQQLRNLYNTRPNSFLNRVFFDAKAEEIASIFAGGPTVPVDNLKDNLNRIAPFYLEKWQNIKL